MSIPTLAAKRIKSLQFLRFLAKSFDLTEVKVKSTSIFGGVSEKKHRPYVENAVTVYINATCMFGGVEIK